MRKDIFIPEHRTKVLPLRWLANYIFHPASMVFFRMGLRANEQIYESNEGYTIRDEIKEIVGSRMYRLLDRPYSKWGTLYKLDKDLLSDTTGLGWDDYDESGHAYWDYWWHTDEETGDAWRLTSKKVLTEEELMRYYGVNSREDIDRID